MDFADTPEHAEFRTEFRAWLADNHPGPTPDFRDSATEQAFRMSWHRTMYAGGWLGLSWPKAYGGRALSPLFEAIINEELGDAGVLNAVGPLNWLGRAILLFGTEAQRQRYLAPLLRGETQWCQGFSEPGAGSDLAGLSTYAERDGDTYRDHRPEAVDQRCPVRRLLHGPHPYRSRRAQAQGNLVPHRRDGRAGHHGTSHHAVVGRSEVLRGVLRRGPRRPSTTGSATRVMDGVWLPRCSPTSGDHPSWASSRHGDRSCASSASFRTVMPSASTRDGRAFVDARACQIRLMEGLSRRVRGEDPGSVVVGRQAPHGASRAIARHQPLRRRRRSSGGRRRPADRQALHLLAAPHPSTAEPSRSRRASSPPGSSGYPTDRAVLLPARRTG